MSEDNARQRKPIVYYPREIEDRRFVGDLFGFFHPEENAYNITEWDRPNGGSARRLGRIADNGDAATAEDDLIGEWRDDRLRFRQNGRGCAAEPYFLLLNVFSRNAGILETDAMLSKSVILSGLGSVGSLVALEMARAGVGRFLLIDNDTLAYHNLCRHQCDLRDVGRFKVNAVRDRILAINPTAEVRVETGILETAAKSVFDDFITPETLIVGCADNREGDRYANRIAALYDIPFVSIGFWERAFAGEIFYALPGRTPCYECLFGGDGPAVSARVSRNRRFYTHEEDLSQTRFEPGISADINFITTVGIKLILDLLNRDSDAYVPRLLNDLTQFTLICNTSDPAVGGDQAEIFTHPLQVTRSLTVAYADDCPVCRDKRE